MSNQLSAALLASSSWSAGEGKASSSLFGLSARQEEESRLACLQKAYGVSAKGMQAFAAFWDCFLALTLNCVAVMLQLSSDGGLRWEERQDCSSHSAHITLLLLGEGVGTDVGWCCCEDGVGNWNSMLGSCKLCLTSWAALFMVMGFFLLVVAFLASSYKKALCAYASLNLNMYK